jgi:hypothetical protein
MGWMPPPVNDDDLYDVVGENHVKENERTHPTCLVPHHH